MTISKHIFYDLETTGVDERQNGIHQIAGIVEINNRIEEEFNINLKPHPKAIIEDEALAVGHVTREDLAGYMDMEAGYTELRKVLFKYVDPYNRKDKFHLVGYNNRSFDDKFLRRFFEYNKDNYFGSWFWADSIDVLVLMSYLLRNERAKMDNFKLGTVAQYVGIPFDDNLAHDALYDIRITRQLLKYYGLC